MPSWWDVTNVWQTVPAFVLVASILFYYKSRKIKSLSYKIVTNEPLLTVGEELQGKIKVFYENNPIKDLSLLIIKFLNDGNEPIKSDDFEESITLSFGSNFGVLSVELMDTIPQTINPIIKLDDNKVIIDPLLLNKGDSITIKVLLTGHVIIYEIPYHANLEVNSHPFNPEKDLILQTRITGVTSIKEIANYLSIGTGNYKIKIKKSIVVNFGFIALGVLIGEFIFLFWNMLQYPLIK